MSEFVSQAEFARLSGVSAVAVHKWKGRGLLVMNGQQVDVAASRDLLRRYRRDGVPEPLRRYLAGDAPPPTAKLRAQKLTLPRGEWMQRLHALDWQQTERVWADEAQHQRVVGAAAAVGLVAVLDETPDGVSRHGGYQLRVAELLKHHGGPCTAATWAGFGHELDAHQALEQCRLAIAYPDDGAADLAETLTLDPAALGLLAFPLNPGHRP